MDGNHKKLRENSGKMMLKILYKPCVDVVGSANNKAKTLRMEHVKGRKFTEKNQKKRKIK